MTEKESEPQCANCKSKYVDSDKSPCKECFEDEVPYSKWELDE